MEPIKISRDEARLLAVIGQRLDRRPRGKANKARVMEMIEHLGCVQLDTISVVARSHETVLWSRLGAFDPSIVWKLYKDRKLFEYWTHAAAITPLSMFPYFRVNMDRFREGDVGGWLERNGETVSHVLAQIDAGGPQQSRSFEAPEDANPSPWEWYGGKPAKQALDYLWCVGDLTVVNRQGFQRLYELTERSVPEELRSFRPTIEERQRFFASRALSAMGIATARWVSDYFRGGSRGHVTLKDAPVVLNRLVENGEALSVDVEGFSEPAWLDPG
ncbi:MAG: DNA glycosylase AlkZ-like family protein, partial [Thermomicrobiales bacterium]